MRIVIINTDGREHIRDYDALSPWFPQGHESLLEGFGMIPGIEVHVLSCTQKPMRSPEKLADNIWFHSLHVPKMGWLRTLYQGCIRAVRKKAAELQPDLVHGHGTERDCGISAVFSGFPNLITIHGNMAVQANRDRPRFGSYLWLAARLETFTVRRTLGVFCNSVYTQSVIRPQAQQTWLVPHALRLEFLRTAPPVDHRPCVLLNGGVISPRKRQWELLDVADALHRRGLKFQFQFFGPAPGSSYTDRFLERLKSMESAGYARYLGLLPQEDVVPCLDSAAAMIHFPSEEAFGNVVVEALSRNLKFFGSRVGGITDIAAAAPGAELFELDDWSALTEGIAKWIVAGHRRPNHAAELIQAKYHPQIIAQRHLEIYREVLSIHASTRS